MDAKGQVGLRQDRRFNTFAESLAAIQSYYQGLSAGDVIWSEELIKQRRIEAAIEASDE